MCMVSYSGRRGGGSGRASIEWGARVRARVAVQLAVVRFARGSRQGGPLQKTHSRRSELEICCGTTWSFLGRRAAPPALGTIWPAHPTPHWTVRSTSGRWTEHRRPTHLQALRLLLLYAPILNLATLHCARGPDVRADRPGRCPIASWPLGSTPEPWVVLRAPDKSCPACLCRAFPSSIFSHRPLTTLRPHPAQGSAGRSLECAAGGDGNTDGRSAARSGHTHAAAAHPGDPPKAPLAMRLVQGGQNPM